MDFWKFYSYISTVYIIRTYWVKYKVIYFKNYKDVSRRNEILLNNCEYNYYKQMIFLSVLRTIFVWVDCSIILF